MNEIRKLNNLNRLNHGLNKQWIWGSRENFYSSYFSQEKKETGRKIIV